MKLHEETRTVTRSGSFPEKKFAITANAKAFDILSSRIYNDAKLAIVRELSTNAADAHIEAGNADQPFDVHLPNHLEPHFSIRDYGTGLSCEDMETVYTTYFESTRNDSNEFTGALGLGSKSPFSYTDQFTVTSWFGGQRYDYSCFKGEDGSPTLALLNVTDSDEPNGIRIEIAIKSYHHIDFANVAGRVYRFFKVRPNITGYQINISDADPIVSGDGFDLYDNQAGITTQVSVVMGQVHYKVDEDKFKHGIGYNGRLVLHAEIGACSIAASREELHYDTNTVTYIQKMLDEARENAATELQKEITGKPTRLAEAQALSRYRNLMAFEYDTTRIDCTADAYELKRLSLRGDKLYIGKDDRYLEPTFTGRYVFIECDVRELTQRFKNRIRQYIQTQKGDTVHFFLITVKDTKVTEEMFGDPDAKISELPDAVRQSGGGASTSGPRCSFKRLRGTSYRMSDAWLNVNDPDNEDTTGGCVVPRKGYRVVWQGRDVRPDGFAEIAAEIGLDKVYGLPASRYEKQKKASGLPDLETAAKAWITKHVATWSEAQRHVFHHGVDFGWRNEKPSRELMRKMVGLSDECDNLIELMGASKPSSAIRQMIHYFRIPVPEPIKGDPKKVFFEKYPLITSQCGTINLVDEIIAYINLKETK